MHSEGGEVENLNEAVDHLCKEAGEAWLGTNSTLFRHALEYQNKLNNFLMESDDAIEVLHDHIWTVMLKVMEDADAPSSDGLGISVCLVDMLPPSQYTDFPHRYTDAHWFCTRSMLASLG